MVTGILSETFRIKLPTNVPGGTLSLTLKDWDEIYKRSGDGWQQQLADTTNEFQQEIQL